jgi:FixJ family two-component response regulator
VGIVDDDPSMLKAAGDLLDAHGLASRKFASAEEFLTSPVAAQVDCLLLDIHLGGMSGLELRRHLKAEGSHLPIIFMTALDDEATRQQAFSMGVTCLRKPFAASQLMDAIDDAIG